MRRLAAGTGAAPPAASAGMRRRSRSSTRPAQWTEAVQGCTAIGRPLPITSRPGRRSASISAPAAIASSRPFELGQNIKLEVGELVCRSRACAPRYWHQAAARPAGTPDISVREVRLRFHLASHDSRDVEEPSRWQSAGSAAHATGRRGIRSSSGWPPLLWPAPLGLSAPALSVLHLTNPSRRRYRAHVGPLDLAGQTIN